MVSSLQLVLGDFYAAAGSLRVLARLRDIRKLTYKKTEKTVRGTLSCKIAPLLFISGLEDADRNAEVCTRR